VKLDAALNSFETVGLQSISKVAALFRFDTKFLLTSDALLPLLNYFNKNFSILEITGQRQHFYDTVYFDTPDYKLYLDHHKGKPNRMKVRIRKYETTGEVFFEVKHKLKGLQTGKLRLPRQKMMFEISNEEWEAIKSHDKNIHGLEKKLITTFNRITLSNKSTEERITIDTDLCFNNFVEGKCMSNVVIVEVKHPKPHISQTVRDAMKLSGAQESSFSKYAIGVALLEKNVKKNLFKPTLLQLQKTSNGFT